MFVFDKGLIIGPPVIDENKHSFNKIKKTKNVLESVVFVVYELFKGWKNYGVNQKGKKSLLLMNKLCYFKLS